MLRRGRRSDFTIVCAASVMCRMNISVAMAMAKAALLEQLLMSSSAWMIFLTRVTAREGVSLGCLLALVLQRFGLTRQGRGS